MLLTYIAKEEGKTKRFAQKRVRSVAKIEAHRKIDFIAERSSSLRVRSAMCAAEVNIVILHVDCIVDPSKNDTLHTQQPDDSEAINAWNEVMQQARIHCDIFFEEFPSESSLSVHAPKISAQHSEPIATTNIKGSEIRNEEHEQTTEHHRNQRRQLLKDDSWQVFPNHTLPPCSTPDNVWTLRAAFNRRVQLNLLACNFHLGGLLPFQATALSLGSSTSSASKPSSFHTNDATDNENKANSNPFSKESISTTPNHYALTVIPLPNQFSWESTPEPRALNVQIDLTKAKHLFVEAWKANRKDNVTTESETVSKHVDQAGPHNTSRTKAVDNPNLFDTTGTSNSTSHTRNLHTSAALCPPAAEAYSEQLVRATFINNAHRVSNEHSTLIRQNMEIMMKREMDDINAVLAIMGVFAVVLAVFLGWTAHQIAVENNGKNSSRKSSKTMGETKKDAHVVGLTVGGNESSQLNLPTDGTISPLSLDAVFQKNCAETPTDQLHADFSPCSKMQVNWLNNRAVRRRNCHSKRIVPQSWAEVEINENNRESTEISMNKKTFLLHPVKNNVSMLESPVRPSFQENSRKEPSLIDEPVMHVDLPKQKQHSLSFLDELKSRKVQLYRSTAAAADVQNYTPKSTAADTLPALAPSHTRSFIEDYW